MLRELGHSHSIWDPGEYWLNWLIRKSLSIQISLLYPRIALMFIPLYYIFEYIRKYWICGARENLLLYFLHACGWSKIGLLEQCACSAWMFTATGSSNVHERTFWRRCSVGEEFCFQNIISYRINLFFV